MRSIKRYSNRKLYDTTERHYVTLSQVAAAIRKGEDVKVTDYITGHDLTNQTLAQIIFEEAKQSVRIPTETFVKLLRVAVPAADQPPV